jgi:CO dehydrogenase maturation factor
MKLAITGKGGVGKTTLTSLLAYAFTDREYQVMAIDADPSPCLGAALGFPDDLLSGLTPIARLDELIMERTGAKPGTTGGFFKLNPRVDDLPDEYSAAYRGIRLLELGAVEMGGAGCICPESAMLRSLTTHLLLRRDEVILMDLYAGVEHLGRATADAVDAMLIVVEPTARSLATAEQIKALAEDIKLQRLFIVGSKTANVMDQTFIQDHAPDIPVLGFLDSDPKVREADRSGQPVYDLSPTLVSRTNEIIAALTETLQPA